MASDFRITIFGSNRLGKLTATALAKFEKQIGLKLPADYRRFMLTHNGGKPNRRRFIYKDEYGRLEPGNHYSVVECFLSIHERPYREKRNYRPSPEEEFPHHCDQPLQSVYRDYMKENPADNVVPFARDPCGNLLVIGCKGVTKDWIFFYDHEMESHFALRKSFRQFLNSLRNE